MVWTARELLPCPDMSVSKASFSDAIGAALYLSQVAREQIPTAHKKSLLSGQARVLGELRDLPESRLKNNLFEGPNRYSSRALGLSKAFSCSEDFHSCDSGSFAPNSSEGTCLVSKPA